MLEPVIDIAAVTIALAFNAAVSIAVLTAFLSKVTAVRKSAWIAARPQLEPASIDRMPEGIRETVAQVTLPLAGIGFVVAENVQAPRFSTYALWSQVLFVNRATGERASVIGVKELKLDNVTFAFAMDLSDGPKIVTSWTRRVSPPTPAVDQFATDTNRPDVLSLYARHREAVAQAIAARSTGASQGAGAHPKEGDELQWLRDRAALVAAETARKKRFKLDASGDYFRPTWARAARLALTKRMPGTRAAGFDVVARR
jgi:hypothetical protein